jgi:putative membrane protein
MSPNPARFILPALLVSMAPLTARAQGTPPNLTDPEVAHVAVTANAIDIELARLAQSRARSPEVRRFAATMITDHSAVNAQAGALAGKLGVTPADNAVSQGLLSGAAQARAGLERLQGAAFDQAYMAREVAYHQAVLDALDGLLIPTTENRELRTLLIDVRPAIAAHLGHAKQLQQAVGTAP